MGIWEKVSSRHLHAHRFGIHTCTHLQKYTQTHLQTCMLVLWDFLLLTLSKPALKDNKRTMNNMQFRARCREVEWSKQIRIKNVSMSMCLYAHLSLCALFTFEEELYLFSAKITVRYALKTSYCRDGSAHSTTLSQSLWDRTVWDITGRIPWKREISFVFTLSESDKARTTSPSLSLNTHTHIHKQCGTKHESWLVLKSNMNFF